MTDLTMLAFWAGLLAAFAYLPFSAREPGMLRSAGKTLPLLCFASSSWLAGAHPYLTAALLLSAVGDLALSRPSQRAFNYGLAAFSLTHILYTLLFTSIARAPLWVAFAEAPLFAVAMIALAISAEIWLLPHTGALRWPVRAYVALITAMMLSALNLPAIVFIATLGAAAFVASDFVLSVQMFRMNETAKRRAATGWLVWGLYIGGQSMILWGAALI